MSGLIVAGVDGSPSSLDAAVWAADYAQRLDAELRIVHVREPWGRHVSFHGQDDYERLHIEHCLDVLAVAARRAHERAAGLSVSTDLVQGAVIERLKGESERADTVVIGSRGVGGFSGLVLGSVGMGLAGHASCPVVVHGHAVEAERGEIAVGFDGSPHAESALEYAIGHARLRGARLRVIYAWPLPVFSPYSIAPAGFDEMYGEAVRADQRRLGPWRDKHPEVEIVDSVVTGHPVWALADASASADLVVVGSRGLGGVGAALLGSVSHGVLHHAECPVAVVPQRS